MKQIPIETIRAYRAVLLKDQETREVLQDILSDLYFFSHTLETQEAVSLHNYSKALLAKLGIMLPSQIANVMDALALVPEPRILSSKEPNDNERLSK